jgi:hypothetical protein
VNKQNNQLQWLKALVMSAQNRDWYGSITIEIKRGMIDKVMKVESLKPPCDENS